MSSIRNIKDTADVSDKIAMQQPERLWYEMQ